VTVDVYTCGDLPIDETLQFVCRAFGTTHYEHHHLVRGLKYHTWDLEPVGMPTSNHDM
jgi:S-adenosylmethionine/arginine decarboxylase-like enzyme